MKIGYVRSTKGLKDLESKETAIKPYVEKVYSDLILEPGAGKPHFNMLMTELVDGDKLYVLSLSSLSRSVRDLLQVLELLGNKGVALASIDEGLDTETLEGKSTLKVLQALIDLDKETMEEWKKDYIEAAKKRLDRTARHGRKQ